MGWLSWHTAAGGSGADATAFSPRRQVLFAVTVSLFNPHAILDTVGVIGTSSVSYHGQDKLLFAAACVSVSWGWFLALAFIGWKTGRQKGFDKVAGVINKLSAGFMWLSAAVLVYSNL